MLLKIEKGGNEKLSLKVVVYFFSLGFYTCQMTSQNDDVISRVVYKQHKLVRCSNKECCKQCRYVMFKGTMTKWPVQKLTQGTTQNSYNYFREGQYGRNGTRSNSRADVNDCL